ncbi:uncharacterized protein MONOS_8094 [Monocercomonoides exilis]|uniref:uncharacterized protein n=1 Tax=Monocercomonoides exilis TaxID=2049356 RepID=UPI00355A93EC|nr:hypothetical protein MONOS_8094 [Monocercomonoides exilis]|eukprot:MONOS_8094.1-p1 / transcript=MONOS_8094.1 / gene=MONOS_8094 / organism=Monocercomonoides_exilis_PA203 / gene_product=unspecified product / transcript_product=unspecified product / location=Mono_scaffold00296:13866-14423(+) / protein_length=186 / sequence_SO=supercontig / SO=protein_coding / is_pseudo=false
MDDSTTSDEEGSVDEKEEMKQQNDSSDKSSSPSLSYPSSSFSFSSFLLNSSVEFQGGAFQLPFVSTPLHSPNAAPDLSSRGSSLFFNASTSIDEIVQNRNSNGSYSLSSSSPPFCVSSSFSSSAISDLSPSLSNYNTISPLASSSYSTIVGSPCAHSHLFPDAFPQTTSSSTSSFPSSSYSSSYV